MERPHEAQLVARYDDRDRAAVVAASVGVEAGEVAAVDGRSQATVRQDGTGVEVEIAAADTTALRAACNTWSRLLSVAERMA